MNVSLWIVWEAFAKLAKTLSIFVPVLGLSSAELTEPKETRGSETDVPRPYMRVERSDNGEVALQIAARKFVVPGRIAPVVWLVGVSHVGETNYYRMLQKFLDKQALVLFEGVGYDPRVGFKAPKDSEDSGSAGLQATLANSLGLAFQLEAIDYDRSNFRNSDISLRDLERLLTPVPTEGSVSGDPGGGGETNPEFVALLEAMDGSSWTGKLLHMGIKFLGANPKLKAMARLMLVEMLGQIEGDIAQLQGVPPDLQELMRVLIQSRNKVVVEDVRKSMETESPPDSIAVFYGAAHMADFEKRLTAQFTMRRESETWFSAVTINAGEGGLSVAESAMVRGLVRLQMNVLREQVTQPAE
ncbi:MAG: hypothetical protein K9N62_08670 [Verrucomicrobia bacterium]|nr:hypothetical protein [Verrucomicrobiota bacterium]